MSTTYNVALVKNRNNHDEGYLVLRTIKNRKPKDRAIGITIKTKNWNKDKQSVYSKEPNANIYNAKIEEVLLEARSGRVTNITLRNKKESFVSFASKVIEVIHNTSTRKVRQNALDKHIEFLKTLGKDDIEFDDIDKFHVKNYYKFLLESNLKRSTSNEYFTVFKNFVSQAVEQEKHIYPIDPFGGFYKKGAETEVTVMTEEEVEKFFAYKPIQKDVYQIQKVFGFMMYAAGMRISDALSLKWRNFYKQGDSYYLKYEIEKTKKIVDTKLSIEALIFLIPFIEEYDKDVIRGYRTLERKQQKLWKEFTEAALEESEIKLKSFRSFGTIMILNEFDKFNKSILEEAKKEERMIALQQYMRSARKSIDFNKQVLLSTLAESVLRIKDKYPEENVLPFLRGYSGDEYRREQHNFKVYSNYRLKKIQRACKIKTTVTNHQARHVFAQRMFLKGANFHSISIALGHSSLQVTENYRAKLITDETKNLTEDYSNHFPLSETMFTHKS